MGLGTATSSARHSEPSGPDASRQRVITGDAGIRRAWNFAALGRGNTQGHFVTNADDVRPQVRVHSGRPSALKRYPGYPELQANRPFW